MSVVSTKHFTPAELAEAWGVSVDTIRNLFRNEPGVLKIGDRESRFKRGYITLRIPQAVAERFTEDSRPDARTERTVRRFSRQQCPRHPIRD